MPQVNQSLQPPTTHTHRCTNLFFIVQRILIELNWRKRKGCFANLFTNLFVFKRAHEKWDSGRGRHVGKVWQECDWDHPGLQGQNEGGELFRDQIGDIDELSPVEIWNERISKKMWRDEYRMDYWWGEGLVNLHGGFCSHYGEQAVFCKVKWVSDSCQKCENQNVCEAEAAFTSLITKLHPGGLQ